MRFLILMTVFAASSLMAEPVLSFNTSTAASGNNNPQTVGWEFDVLSTITVTGLGWYDPQLAHTVGIWSSTGTLLTSAIVLPGTTDPLDGLFRTVSITPIVLTPGEYVVGGQNFDNNNTEPLAFGVTPTTSTAISFVGGVFSAGTAFEFPTDTFLEDTDCCWGPSFSIGAASVPEPANVSTLLAIGILAVALLARRRRIV